MPALRDAFLALSTNPAAHKAIVGFPLSRKFTRRFVVGETLADAVHAVQQLNEQGLAATLDHLGESVTNADQARRAKDAYLAALDAIAQHRLRSHVSIKLTHMGLDIDPALCLDNIEQIAAKAQSIGSKMRIDMEDSTRTQVTLDLFKTLRARYADVGIVIQAYLRRTVDDVSGLEDLQPNYRLCKGVYVEPRGISYRDMRIINRNYIYILEKLLRNGSYVGIATHDELMVWEAFRIIRDLKLPPTAYEFQMLLGVDDQLRDIIRAAGHNIRIYIPFGRDWYAYSVRRLKENPQLAGYVFKAMFNKTK